MKVSDFENVVWTLEKARLVLRAAENSEVSEYSYQNAATQDWSVKKWLDSRVVPCLNGIDVVVIQGNGERAHGRLKLRNLKESYSQ